jgi:hypothetical protein
MMRMRIRRYSPPWLLLPVLSAGLVTAVLTTTWIAVPPDRPAPARPAVAAQGAAAALGAAAAPETAADRAVQLEALLGQHSVLAADVMRSRIRGDDDFVQSANAALGRNTDAMTDLVRRLFGAAAANAFAPQWSEHIVQLVAYAGALGDHDDAARKAARDKLVTFEGGLADFFAGASKGRLKPADARAAVAMHVEHLTTQADAYAAGDYAKADRINREGYEHTYDMGLALADALLPAGDRAALQAPVWRLRSQLGKLLAEHAVLVEDVTRAAVTNTPDFDAAAKMINANTQALGAAMDTLFGAAAARQFQAVWAAHVEQLVAYSAGAAAKDTARQEAAKAELRGIEDKMAKFLSTATGGRMSGADLSKALTAHDGMLLRHADAYAARDYPAAHDVAYQTYDHMFQVAQALADGFGATVAARLPQGGAQTGYGGLATTARR